MNRRSILGAFAMTMLGLAVLSGSATAQDKTLKQQLIGAWSLVSVYDQTTDGKKNDVWGPGVQGSLMLSPTGRFSYFVVAANRQKAATNDARNGPMGPIVGFYGTYTTDDGAKSLTFHIERSTFPQWDGLDRTAKVELLTGDELSFANSTVHTPDLGDIVPHLGWQRVK